MQTLDLNGLECQRRIKLALSEVNGLELRQQQLDTFIRQNLQTQRQLEADLQRYEATLDEELQKYNVQAQASHQDATSRRTQMYEDASQLNENLNQLTHTIGDMVLPPLPLRPHGLAQIATPPGKPWRVCRATRRAQPRCLARRSSG